MERTARAQIHQDKSKEAHRIYTSLVESPNSHGRPLLSNLGFIKRRLGNAEQAQGYYESALKEPVSIFDSNEASIERQLALSGLFACFHDSGATSVAESEIAAALTDYPDVTSSAICSAHLKMPIKEGPFQFAIGRQLESLLSTYSISITSPEGATGIAFLDGDPLVCVHQGRNA